MKNTIRLIIAALLLAVGGHLQAQQDPNYTFYRYNMNIYNPAYAGSEESAEFALGLRSQWTGIEGAPVSQSAIFSMPVGKKIGLGASVLNDKTFIEKQTWISVDVSYFVNLNESTSLHFGIKGSGVSYNANTSGLVNYGVGQDASLTDYSNRFTSNFGAGVYLRNKKYFVSLSIPKILTPDRLREQDGEAYMGASREHVYLSGGHDFNLGSKVVLHALTMIRYVDASPIFCELTGLFDVGNRFTLGAGYRFSEGISGMFLFNITQKINLGYAYESAWQRPISGIGSSTHEFFMRFTL